MIDYHIHLEQGPFTLPWLQEFWNQAQKVGITELGITEHAHQFKEFRPAYEHLWQVQGLDPEIRAWLERHFQYTVEEYLALLQEGRKAGIPIKAGLEVDYFPQSEAKIRELLAGYELDYVLGSVHFIGMWAFDHTPELGWPERSVDQAYLDYLVLLEQLVNSGICDVLAHLDVIKVFGHRPKQDLQTEWEKLLRAVSRADLAIEVSTAGLRKRVGEMYPQRQILEAGARLGVPITIASDAHRPQDVGDRWQEAVAFATLAGYRKYNSYTKRRRVEHELPSL